MGILSLKQAARSPDQVGPPVFFPRSQTRCAAVAALPPLPNVYTRRPLLVCEPEAADDPFDHAEVDRVESPRKWPARIGGRIRRRRQSCCYRFLI